MPDPSHPPAVEAEPNGPESNVAYASSQTVSAAAGDPTDLLAMIRRAVADPEAVVGRRIHTDFGDPVTETIESWSARAVAVVAVARAAADVEIAELRRELTGARGRQSEHRLWTWDPAAHSDLDGLADILLDLSGGGIKLYQVDTGDGRHAIVLATGDLDVNQIREIYG